MIPLETRVTPSLLDRLTDHAPSVRAEASPNRSHTLRVLKTSLWRDLTALLNTKRREEEVPAQYVEASRSILTYGLPDFSSYILTSQGDQDRVRRAIEATIRRFEPRLKNVTVSLEPSKKPGGGLRFSVDALLLVEPGSEPIRFETLLQTDSRHFLVQGEIP